MTNFLGYKSHPLMSNAFARRARKTHLAYQKKAGKSPFLSTVEKKKLQGCAFPTGVERGISDLLISQRL
jgi:hypothetical protein